MLEKNIHLNGGLEMYNMKKTDASENKQRVLEKLE
jgi:hypothetical protein